MHVEYVSMVERAQRSAFIARRFVSYLKGRVLDVGCDKAVLKSLVPGIDYVGVDVGGTPDLVVNLERERLPFPDASFDCVVCSDVLEHLDNLHAGFGELVRVARGRLIISLPNNWANARLPLARGRGKIGHYGLPPEPPKDRHKWFFSLSEAAAFVRAQPARHDVRVVDEFAVEKPRPAPVRWLRRAAYPQEARYLDRYGHSYWAVLARGGADPVAAAGV
jgi:SAM-dependent methyltransferase